MSTPLTASQSVNDRGGHSHHHHHHLPASIPAAARPAAIHQHSAKLAAAQLSPARHHEEQFRMLRDRFLICRCLHKGPNSTVVAAMQRSSRRQCAVKIVPKRTLADRSAQLAVAREVSLLARLNHPHLVQFVDAFETREAVFIATEFCTCDLFSYLSQTHAGLPEREALELIRQILVVVDFLHGHSVAHRDIKLENIMLTGVIGSSASSSDAESEFGPEDDEEEEEEEESNRSSSQDSDALLAMGHQREGRSDAQGMRPCPVVKLTDFGLSYWRAPDATELKTRQRSGTPFYAAPEVLDTSGRGYVPERADLWSCGVVLFALLTRRLPFQGRTFGELRRSMGPGHVRQMVGELWCSDGTKHVLLNLLNADVDGRPCAREAVSLVDNALRYAGLAAWDRRGLAQEAG